MRLFLASYRFGAHRDRLLAMVGGPGRVSVIGNAMDSLPAPSRQSAIVSDVVPLQRLGFTPTEIDLRDYVDDPDALESTLASFPLLWVRGGNTFVLRAQFARSGADSVLPRLLSEDAIAYAGYSAGACVMTPTLLGLDEADDPAEVRPTCGIDPITDGLGLVDRAIVPHWGSELDDGSSHRTARRLRDSGVPFWTLTDEQVIVADHDCVELL